VFEYDAVGLIDSQFELIPNGWFPFRIFDTEELKSSKGYQQVLVKAACLDPRYRDRSVWHWVTFLPKDHKGAGIAIHFLKCIGQPYEDKFIVEAGAWKGKYFMGEVFTDTFKGKSNNKLAKVSPYREDAAPLEEPLETGTETSDDALPF